MCPFSPSAADNVPLPVGLEAGRAVERLVGAVDDRIALILAALLRGRHRRDGGRRRRLAAQDPQATSELVRQILGDRYAKAATETQEGSREFAGTKFHKAIAGNEQRQATLDAALGALPNGAPQGLSELLDVLQATGRRKAIGSATEFNRALNADLGTASPLAYLWGLGKTLGTSAITKAGDAAQRAWMRRNLSSLADLFTDPQSVERIREAAARGAPSVVPEVAGRTAAQALPIMAGSTGR